MGVVFESNRCRIIRFNRIMKFALIDGDRREAAPGLTGACPIDSHPIVARCGDLRTWHWAHKGSPSCDPWWENETEWHRNWKERFPREWQEVIHQTEQGEKHIADVKTDREWIIEFQHSHIQPEERRSRDVFYKKLIWVVDGTRRKRDEKQFSNSWAQGTPIGGNPNIRRTHPGECRLLKEWSTSPSPIFLDFGEQAPLYWILSKGPDKPTYLMIFPREQFIKIHRGELPQDARAFDDLVKDIDTLITRYESQLLQTQQTSPQGFQRYLAQRNSRRRRF